MRAKRPKEPTPVELPTAQISGHDRELLTHAYKTGLIVGWRADSQFGCRLTLDNGRDEYVEITKLPGYLDDLRKRVS